MHLTTRGRLRTFVIALAAMTAVLAAACGGSTAATSAPAPAAQGYAHPDRLVSTDWAQSKLSDATVLFIDLRKPDAYAAGHIPGAASVSTSDLVAVDAAGVAGQLAPVAQIEAALGAAGATPDTTIVFYDDAGSLWAARALWTLDVYGHKDSRILNGTWVTWQDEGRPVSTDPPARTATTYSFSGPPNAQIVTDFASMARAIGDPSKIVCDARSPEEYAGRDVRSKAGGHVPGAINVSYNEAVDRHGAFLPLADLQKIYADAGVKAADHQTIFTYCQTGVRAAHTWFVLSQLIGFKHVAVYDGSWQEWGNRPDSQVATSRS